VHNIELQEIKQTAKKWHKTIVEPVKILQSQQEKNLENLGKLEIFKFESHQITFPRQNIELKQHKKLDKSEKKKTAGTKRATVLKTYHHIFDVHNS